MPGLFGFDVGILLFRFVCLCFAFVGFDWCFGVIVVYLELTLIGVLTLVFLWWFYVVVCSVGVVLVLFAWVVGGMTWCYGCYFVLIDGLGDLCLLVLLVLCFKGIYLIVVIDYLYAMCLLVDYVFYVGYLVYCLVFLVFDLLVYRWFGF